MKKAKKNLQTFLLAFTLTAFCSTLYGQIPVEALPLPVPAMRTPAPQDSQNAPFSGPYTLVAHPREAVQEMPQTAPLPSAPAPAAQSIVPRPVAVTTQQATGKTHQLQNLRAAEFERKLIEKLGKRFVPVRSLDGTDGAAHFRLPGKDGTNVELTIDRQSNVTTVIGSAALVESCIRIVQLLDTRENDTVGNMTTQFLPVTSANLVPVKQMAQAVSQVNIPANTATFQRNGDAAVARFAAPNTAPENAGVVVGPLKQASVFFMISHVSGGIKESPPFAFHHVSPASHI